MTNLTILIIVGVGFAAIVYFFGKKSPSEGKTKEEYHYQPKKFFMTRAEHECFDALVEAVGDQYHVLAQVHLNSIVDHKVTGQNWKAAFRHISQKSVDFVLCDKDYLSPKLAIELDDKTHERPERMLRDAEVERILKDAKVPLLRLENHGSFDVGEIKEDVGKILLKG